MEGDGKMDAAPKTIKGIVGNLADRLNAVGRTRLLVGIPEDPSQADGVTNARKLYENTVGSPLKRVPPRPVLEPAIEDGLERISGIMREGIIKALEGDMESFRAAYDMAGLAAQSACVGWFDNPKNGWEPNSPYTVRMKGSNAPLIDTGEMRQSITYVVEEGGTA